MKKQDRTPLIKRGRRKQCFVFKKFNKQLISIVGSTMLLLGNYALIPIQVIATETAATENAPPTFSEEELSTIATVDPASPVNSTETSQEEVKSAPTDEQPAPQNQTDPQQNEVENTEDVLPTPNKEQVKKADQPPQSSPTPQLDDWEASEENGYMVISKYTGDWMNITVPSEIEGKPVQIDLKTVLGSTLIGTTRTFAIEESKGSGPVKLTGSFSDLFSFNSNLQSADFADADTSDITDMSYMFGGCRQLTSLNISSWDTSSVTNMSYMFSFCTQLTIMDLSSWNTSSVTSMLGMFFGCSNLSEITCSKTFKMDNTQYLRSLPAKENEGATTYYWRVDGQKNKKYETTNALIDGHSNLSDTDVHTYTIEKQHNVIFDTDEGSDPPAATAIWDCEKLADPEYKGTKTNYQFVDWFLDDQVFNFKKTQITEPIALIAKWRLNRYSIQFNENGGTGKMKDQLLDYEEEKSLSENAFTRTGYTFDTWNTKIDGQGTTYTDKQTVKNLSSEDGATITLYAQWKANNYQVQFDSNGGEGIMASQPMTYDQTTNLTENTFTRKGYAFSGWNTQEDGQGTSFTDKVAVKNLTTEKDGQVKLYAQWKIHTYTIDFNSNGGETVSSKKYTVETESFVLPKAERKGYTFQGWYDGDKKVEIIEKGTVGDKELTAKWKVIEYTISFDSAGGSEVLDQTYTIEQGISSFKAPTRKGYTFQGWYDEEGKEVERIEDGETGNRTLTAQWKIDTYTIDFNSNGGEAVSSKKYTVETESFVLPKAERKGYTFQGWYDGDKKIETIEKGSTGNKELTAKWKVIEYTVSFDSGGGSEVTDQTYTIEQGIGSFKAPTRKGYTFQGWYDGDKKVEMIEKGTVGDKELTAKWKVIEYMVSFNSGGGSEVTDQTYTIEQGIASFKAPTRKGYTFQGWYDGDKKVEIIEKGTVGDKELTAKWKVIEYTVSFDSAGGSEVLDQTYTIEQGIGSFKAPTRKGYTFQGWYDEEGKEVERIEDGETGNRTLVAKWTIITYTITFDDLAMDPIKYTVESDTIPLTKKERVGYTFLGWLVEEDTIARVLSDQPMIVQEIKSGTTGNLKLSAQWKANQYTISFDPNGGIGELPSQTLNYDESVKLSGNKFTRTGYAFTGWNTQADGKGTTFTDKQEVKNLLTEANGNLTLFAQWKTTKSALEELLNKEKEAKRDKSKYTQESWKKYEDALKQAQGVLADLNATEDEVKTALTELQAAIANLKPFKNSDQIAQTSTRKTYPTSAAKSYPGTGMLAGSGLMILGVAAVGTAIAGWKKRKGK